jgi:hypothetical protein
VSDSAGSSSSRCNSVVLPEPRKPVINVTGVKWGEVSAKLTLHEGDQFLIERIAGPAEEALGGHPQLQRLSLRAAQPEARRRAGYARVLLGTLAQAGVRHCQIAAGANRHRGPETDRRTLRDRRRDPGKAPTSAARCDSRRPNRSPRSRFPKSQRPNRTDPASDGGLVHSPLNEVSLQPGLLGKASRDIERYAREIEPSCHRAASHERRACRAR